MMMLGERGYRLVPPLRSEPNEYLGFIGRDAPPPTTTYWGNSSVVIVRQVDSSTVRRVIAVTLHNAEASVRLDALLSVSAVLAHYAHELMSIGRKVSGGGEDGPLHVTTMDALGRE